MAEQKTMICELEQIAQQTCDLLSEAQVQTGLQTLIEKEAGRILQIAQAAYPAAEIELQRLDAVRAEVEECCPKETPTPMCVHRPCPPPPDFTERPAVAVYKPLQPMKGPPG